jgi:hypothetical protein
MNLACSPQCFSHIGAGKTGGPSDVKYHLLASGDEVDCGWKLSHGEVRNDDSAVKISMDYVTMVHRHSEDVHVAFHRNKVDMSMAWPDTAADDLKTGREHVEVTKRAISDASGDPEPGVNCCLHLSPKSAKAGPIVNVLNDGNRGQVTCRDIVVPIFTLRHGSTRRFLCSYEAGPGQTDDRRELAVNGDHRLHCETNGATLRNDKLQRVADRRCVPALQDLEIGCGERPKSPTHNFVARSALRRA